MRATMEKMEEEREQLVAEVEAQIEKALISMTMTLEMSDSDEGSNVDGQSRPSSKMSSRPNSKTGSRRSSNATRSPPRTLSIDSATLAGTAEYDELARDALESSTIPEEEEVDASPEEAVNNIDASEPAGDRSQDAMVAVDEGIHHNSDRIAQSVMQIQQKVS